MRDSVSATLISFVFAQLVLVALLAFVVAFGRQGIDNDVYMIALDNMRKLVTEAEAITVILFTVAICALRWFDERRLAVAVPVIGVALLLGPFYIHTQHFNTGVLAAHAWTFYLAYAVLTGLVGWVFVALARFIAREGGPAPAAAPAKPARSKRS